MGTRSNIIIKESGIESRTLVNICRQYDGYPPGHGAELKETFGNTKIINGFNGHKAPDYANGMGCLSAQIIQELKDGIGDIYIVYGDSADEDFGYILYLKDEPSFSGSAKLYVKVIRYGEEIYNGLLSEMPTVI